MDDNGETRDDLKCPDNEIGEEIRNAQKDEKDILVSGFPCYFYGLMIGSLSIFKFLRSTKKYLFAYLHIFPDTY